VGKQQRQQQQHRKRKDGGRGWIAIRAPAVLPADLNGLIDNQARLECVVRGGIWRWHGADLLEMLEMVDAAESRDRLKEADDGEEADATA
jgi:hypothetical protein